MRTRKPSKARRPSGFAPSGGDAATPPPSRASSSPNANPNTDPIAPAANVDAAGEAAQADAGPRGAGVVEAEDGRGRPGITRDDRLREELAHPFRRPKLVLFGTLALSAFVGTLFASGRLATGADPLDVFGVNVAINAPAVALFAFLAKREVDFGRRSLGVIAGCPEARDLPLDARLRLGSVGGQGALHIVAGRARDLADVLVHAELDGFSLVAVAVDAGELDPVHLGPRVWAPNLGDDADSKRAWESWLSGVERKRKQVAVFRVPDASTAKGMGEEYFVTMADAAKLDLSAIVREA